MAEDEKESMLDRFQDMKPLEKVEFLENEYGSIKCTKIARYWKYRFVLHVYTDKGFKLRLVTGGNEYLIYKYDLEKFTDWREHLESTVDDLFEWCVLKHPEEGGKEDQ